MFAKTNAAGRAGPAPECELVLPSATATLCIVANRCVLEQKLLLRAYGESYEKLIGTKMNDLDLHLEVASRSRQRQPLRYI